MGRQRAVASMAAAKLYCTGPGRWVPSGIEGIAIYSMDKHDKDVQFISLYGVGRDEARLMFETALYYDFAYRPTSLSHFHSFETEREVFGLSFASVTDAHDFAAKVATLQPRRRQPPSMLPLPEARQQAPDGAQQVHALAPSSTSGSEGEPRGASTWAKFKGIFWRERRNDSDGASQAGEVDIGMPTDVQHRTHVGVSDEKGFDLRNVPPDWRQLFRHAGIRKRDLGDETTLRMVMETIAQHSLAHDQGTEGRYEAQERARGRPVPVPTSTHLGGAPAPFFRPPPRVAHGRLPPSLMPQSWRERKSAEPAVAAKATNPGPRPSPPTGRGPLPPRPPHPPGRASGCPSARSAGSEAPTASKGAAAPAEVADTRRMAAVAAHDVSQSWNGQCYGHLSAGTPDEPPARLRPPPMRDLGTSGAAQGRPAGDGRDLGATDHGDGHQGLWTADPLRPSPAPRRAGEGVDERAVIRGDQAHEEGRQAPRNPIGADRSPLSGGLGEGRLAPAKCSFDPFDSPPPTSVSAPSAARRCNRAFPPQPGPSPASTASLQGPEDSNVTLQGVPSWPNSVGEPVPQGGINDILASTQATPPVPPPAPPVVPAHADEALAPSPVRVSGGRAAAVCSQSTTCDTLCDALSSPTPMPPSDRGVPPPPPLPPKPSGELQAAGNRGKSARNPRTQAMLAAAQGAPSAAPDPKPTASSPGHGELLAQIRAGAKLKPVAAPVGARQSEALDPPASLLAEIRAGHKLRPVSETRAASSLPPLKTMSTGEQETLADSLAAAIVKRRRHLRQGSEMRDEDDDWSD